MGYEIPWERCYYGIWMSMIVSKSYECHSLGFNKLMIPHKAVADPEIPVGWCLVK